MLLSIRSSLSEEKGEAGSSCMASPSRPLVTVPYLGDTGTGITDDTALGNVYLNDTIENADVNFAIRASNITLSRANFDSPPTHTPAPTPTTATVKISSLPFNITAPGTYVLAGDLDVTTAGGINISTALAGPVVLDLKRLYPFG